MPEKEHAELERAARKKGLSGDAKDAYVFGTLRLIEVRRELKKRRLAKKSSRK